MASRDSPQLPDELTTGGELLNMVAEFSGVAAWEYDYEQDRMLRSANHDALYGLTWQEPWRVATFLDQTHPDDRSFADETIRRSSAPGGPDDYDYDFRVITPAGETRWLWVRGRVVARDSSGLGRVLRGVIVDVTARHELEERADKAARLYAALSECNQSIILCDNRESLFERIVASLVRIGLASCAIVIEPVVRDRPWQIVARDREWLIDLQSAVAPLMQDQVFQAQGDGLVRIFMPEQGESLAPLSEVPAREQLVAVVPISLNGAVAAHLVVQEARAGIFGGEAIALLREMAGDLSYALEEFESLALRRASSESLRSAEEKFRLAFECNMSPMVFTDIDDQILEANDAFCALTGYSREEVLGHDSKIFSHPEDVQMTESALERARAGESQISYSKRYVRKDGRVITVEVMRSFAKDENGRVLYHVISERDVTAERALNQQLAEMAMRDPLTGLANRVFVEAELELLRGRAEREGEVFTVLILDLDNFKGVNDALGHTVGDELLLEVAKNLQSVTRSGDTIARLGGDEFLYLAIHVGSQREIEAIGNRLLGALASPLTISSTQVSQGASVGAACWTSDIASSVELIRRSDIALYEAKRRGRGLVVAFEQSMDADVAARFSISQDLRRALVTDEISMHYQPIVSLTSGEIVGFEALMRWRHPSEGWISPSVFIPVAEESDLINMVSERAFADAMSTAAQWHNEFGDEAPYISVNVSNRRFRNANFVDFVKDQLSRSMVPGRLLVVEITERTLLANLSIVRHILSRLSDIDVRVALDDFGTGYSSLSYLAQLRPDIIKIDRSFVELSGSFPGGDALLDIVVQLGVRLGLTVIAEGIEGVQERESLTAMGCHAGQGFLWSPAVADDEATDFIRRGWISQAP